MYQEMRTKDDAWMQSIHESIDQLSEILDSIPKNGTTSQNDDEYLCDKEVAYMLKVSRRTLSEYRSNGTLPYYVLGGKVLYKRSEIEQALKREYNGKYLMNGSINPSIFLEGVKFTACPIFICFKIIVPLWIETRTAYKWVVNVRTLLYAVYLSLSTFSSVVHFRCRLHF